MLTVSKQQNFGLKTAETSNSAPYYLYILIAHSLQICTWLPVLSRMLCVRQAYKVSSCKAFTLTNNRVNHAGAMVEFNVYGAVTKE